MITSLAPAKPHGITSWARWKVCSASWNCVARAQALMQAAKVTLWALHLWVGLNQNIYSSIFSIFSIFSVQSSTFFIVLLWPIQPAPNFLASHLRQPWHNTGPQSCHHHLLQKCDLSQPDGRGRWAQKVAPCRGWWTARIWEYFDAHVHNASFV